jgi:benzoylformate decarboxylase
VVLVVGAPVFTYHVHSEGPALAAGTRLFHLDCDPAAAAWAVAGTSVLTTVRAGLAALLGLAAETDRPGPPVRVPPEPPSLGDPLDAAAVIAALRAALPPGAVVVEEAPSHRDARHDHLPVTRPLGYTTTGGGALGWGLPVAVGRALAGERVACVTGDGSSLYSVQSLWTAARHRAPLTVVVLNNGRYESVSGLGRRIGIPAIPGTDLPGLDLTALATGFGVAAGRVSTADGLVAALDGALAHEGPFLLDVPVRLTGARIY